MVDLSKVANWAEIGALLLSVVIFLYELWLFRQRRQRRAVTKLIEIIPLARVADSDTLKVKVLFDGKPIDKPHLVRIRLQNSGNVPIPSSDFAAPFTFRFGEHCRILHAEIVGRKPGNLGISMEIGTRTVQIQPDFLNPGDSFVLRVLGARIDETTVDARIVGIGQVLDHRPEAPSARDYVGLALVILLLSLLAFAVQSPFLWGFVAAGLLGLVFQRILLLRVRASAVSRR